MPVPDPLVWPSPTPARDENGHPCVDSHAVTQEEGLAITAVVMRASPSYGERDMRKEELGR